MFIYFNSTKYEIMLRCALRRNIHLVMLLSTPSPNVSTIVSQDIIYNYNHVQIHREKTHECYFSRKNLSHVCGAATPLQNSSHPGSVVETWEIVFQRVKN